MLALTVYMAEYFQSDNWRFALVLHTQA